jgi:hypothetical protein
MCLQRSGGAFIACGSAPQRRNASMPLFEAGAKPPSNTDLVSVSNDFEMRAMHKSVKVLAPSAINPAALTPATISTELWAIHAALHGYHRRSPRARHRALPRGRYPADRCHGRPVIRQELGARLPPLSRWLPLVMNTHTPPAQGACPALARPPVFQAKVCKVLAVMAVQTCDSPSPRSPTL